MGPQSDSCDSGWDVLTSISSLTSYEFCVSDICYNTILVYGFFRNVHPMLLLIEATTALSEE